MRALTSIILAAGLMFAVGGLAYADINPSANPTVTKVGNNFLWQYELFTDAAQTVDTTKNASFFTIYDVNGLITGSENFNSAVLGLTGVATHPLLGDTPLGVLPSDSPFIPNVSVAFAGAASFSTDLGTLSFLDTQGASNIVQSQFAAQGTELNSSRSFNSSFVEAPAPEPGSLMLLSSGILGMVGMGLRRFRKR